MAYLNISANSTASLITVQKHFISAAEAADANDRIEIITASGNYLNMDETNATDAAAYPTAGIVFSTSATDVMALNTTNLTAGFTDNNNTTLFDSYVAGNAVAGEAVTFGEGLYIYRYNNETNYNGDFHGILFIPTIMSKIANLAQDLIDCQCNCELNSAKAQKYIKARAYLDLLISKVNATGSATELIALQPMVTTLTNFLSGTEELCGSC